MEVPQRPLFRTVLKRRRAAAGLTQEELADLAGVSARAVSALERGVNRAPQRETLRLLADALKLTGEERASFEAAARRLAPLSAAGSQPHDADRRTPLVGRVRELALLARHLDDTGPPMFLLAGEPRIGKTRLLEAAMDMGLARAMPVLSGGCREAATQSAFAPLDEAVAAYLAGQPYMHCPAHREESSYLMRLLPDEATPTLPPVRTVSAEPERRCTSQAVQQFLSTVGEERASLLLLDDLQRAAQDALDLLLEILDSSLASRLRLVAAYRHTEVAPGGPFSRFLGDLAGHGMATHVTVGPLSPEEATELLAAPQAGGKRIRSRTRARIVARADGVPLYLLAFAGAVQEGQPLKSLPSTVRKSIEDQLARLSPEAHDLLALAAVMGGPMPRTVLLSAGQLPEDIAVAALQEACRAGLLRENGARGYRFGHEVARQLVEESLDPQRGALAHRRIAAALQQHPHSTGQAAEISRHLVAAGDAKQALRYSLLAGAEAEGTHAWGDAEHHYWIASRLARQLRDRSTEAQAREHLGAVRYLRGSFRGALATLERAATLYRRVEDRDGEARAIARIGWAHSRGRSFREGICRLEPSLRSIEQGDRDLSCETVVDLSLGLSTLYLDVGRYQEGLLLVERASGLAGVSGDRALQARVGERHGLALTTLGRHEDAIAVLKGSIPVLEEAQELACLARALCNLATAHHDGRGDVSRARTALERALEAAQRAGAPFEVFTALRSLGDIAFRIGDWPANHAYLEEARKAVCNLGAAPLATHSLYPRALLYLLEGEWTEASRCIDECRTLAESTRNAGALADVEQALALKDQLQGHLEAALERFETLLTHPCLDDARLTQVMLNLAGIHVAMGHPSLAAQLAEECLHRAWMRRDRMHLPPALSLLGVAEMQQDRWKEADRALAQALREARSIGYRHQEAATLRLRANLYLRRGEPDRARADLQEALDIFRHLGSQPLVEWTERALAEISGRPKLI